MTGVLAGTPLTIGATIDGSPVTSQPLPAIAVLAGAVAQVVVTPAAAALAALGQTQQFAAVARDANGNVVPGQAFTWTSDNPLIQPAEIEAARDTLPARIFNQEILALFTADGAVVTSRQEPVSVDAVLER